MMIRLLALGLAGLLALSACVAVPGEIDGKKVKAARWVNGRVVYILEDDTEVMLSKAAEAQAAARGVRFKPLEKPANE